MPKLATFPKGFLNELCNDGSMALREWIDMCTVLDVDGFEFYSGMCDLKDPARWSDYRKMVEDQGRCIPMLCCSPDFIQRDVDVRQREIDREKHWIDMCADLGGAFCRVLSGQRRPDVSREEGLLYATECIETCLPHASDRGVTLVIENHYKDNFWVYPEFAQHMDVFCELVGRIQSPHFGVNYDPSNTFLAGEDPLELLRRVKDRVVTMHASDRYLAEGTIEDLRREENVEGYADRLRHGVIGQGVNDYDAIFAELSGVGFDSWISIEDGVDGMDQLHDSAAFLRNKIHQYWPS